MCNERRSVNLSLRYQPENFGTVATVYSACLEGEVLAVHVGQGKYLRTVIQSHNGHNGIRTSALPSQLEGIIGSGHFNDYIGSSMRAVGFHKLLTLFRCSDQYLGIMGLHETDALFRFLTHNETTRMFQSGTEQRTDSRRSGSNQQHRIFGRDFRDTSSPKTGGQDVAHEKRLLIRHSVGNTVQPLVGMRHPHIFRLSPVDTATQCPSSVGVLTIVYISVLAEKTFPAESLHVDRHPVTRLHGSDLRSYLFHDAHHLMPHRNARYSTRHAAVLNV